MSEIAYSIVLSAYFGISALFNVKTKSAKILLNKQETKLTSVVHQTARYYFFPNRFIYFQQIHLSLFVYFPHNLNKDKRLLWKLEIFDTINSGKSKNFLLRKSYKTTFLNFITSKTWLHEIDALSPSPLLPLTSKTTSGYFLIPSSNENNLIYLLSSEWGKIR